jgi:hypothetical protein
MKSPKLNTSRDGKSENILQVAYAHTSSLDKNLVNILINLIAVIFIKSLKSVTTNEKQF